MKSIVSLPGLTSCLRGSESGQAVIEYLLVLMVSVAIILGAVFQLNDAFRVWANNYFGNYLACLLETGELPSLGSGEVGLAGICNEQFEPFSLANGRPRSETSEQAANRSSSSSSTNARPSVGSRGRTSGRSGGGSGSSGGRVGRFAPSRSGGQGGAATASVGRSSSSSGEEGESKMMRFGRQSSSGASTVEGQRVSPFRGLGAAGSEKNRIKVPGKNSDLDEAAQVNKQKRMKLRQPASKTPIPEDEPWGFGDWLRYLIIAAIIIAVVIFFGGQALQLSKSMD